MIKVFLVEDEKIIRKSIKNNVKWEENGFEFAGEAPDGEMALPMIEKLHPDIVITDIKMPFMDGLELSKLLKKDSGDNSTQSFDNLMKGIPDKNINSSIANMSSNNTKINNVSNEYSNSSSSVQGAINEASKVSGVNKSSIAKCCRGERKKAGDFIWKFSE